MTADQPRDQTELDRLRAENAALKQRLAAGDAPSVRRHRARAVIAAILAFLTGLLMILAVVSVWTTQTAFNTEKFVARVGPIIEEPEVQSAVATQISTQLGEALDLEARVASALPENVQFLAGPIASGVQTVLDKTVSKVVSSDAFAQVWDQALTLSHEQLMSVLKGEDKTVHVVNGKVVIDLIPVVNEVLQNMSAQLPTIFGQTIALQLPENASLDRIRSAVSTYLGVELPPDFAQIPIANESDLTAAQSGVKIVNTSTVLVVLLALLALVLALVITPGRRRTLLQIGLWTTGFTALVFFVVRGVMSNAVAGVDPAYLADAATAALKTLFSSLREFALILFWAGLVLAVVMYLIGPGRFPVWLRASVARWTRTAAAKVRETSQDEGFSAWLARYLDPLRVGGAVLAALVLLIWPSWTALLIVGILLVLFEVGVTLAAHPPGSHLPAQ
jgi:hypothetical protein